MADRAAGPAPVAVALDTAELAVAEAWAAAVGPHVAMVKVGLELFCRHGPAGVRRVRDAAGGGLFLDLKLHDIPATVGGAAAAAAALDPDLLTVHAAGGPGMVAAAVRAAPGVTVAAVTVLTSLDEPTLAAVGLAGPPAAAVRRLAELAVAAGAGALVCSPVEVAELRAAVGPDVLLVTPGVRPAGSAAHDQARVATPAAALAAGADLLVVGRPLTGAADPAAAAAALAADLRAAGADGAAAGGGDPPLSGPGDWATFRR